MDVTNNAFRSQSAPPVHQELRNDVNSPERSQSSGRPKSALQRISSAFSGLVGRKSVENEPIYEKISPKAIRIGKRAWKEQESQAEDHVNERRHRLNFLTARKRMLEDPNVTRNFTPTLKTNIYDTETDPFSQEAIYVEMLDVPMDVFEEVEDQTAQEDQGSRKRARVGSGNTSVASSSSARSSDLGDAGFGNFFQVMSARRDQSEFSSLSTKDVFQLEGTGRDSQA